MPETKRHLELRTFLYQILKRELSARACVGSEQFVYWDAANPRKCLAPDAFVRLGVADSDFDSWKTWERGAPELAVEIASASDSEDTAWEEKLGRYHALGVVELVRFCPDEHDGRVLQIWDRVDGDLVEREVAGDRGPCLSLGLHWIVVPGAGYPRALRLAFDESGDRVLLTPAEAAEEAQLRGEARIAELEAELRRRS